MQMMMHENISPFRKKEIWGLKKWCETTYKIEDKVHSVGIDNPLQAAVEHFPETSPPVLGYLWFASQADCRNRHPAQKQHQKEIGSRRDSPTLRHPFPSHHRQAPQEPQPRQLQVTAGRGLRRGAAHGEASLSSTPGSGGSGDLLRSEPLGEVSAELCWAVPSPRAGVCRYQWLREQAVWVRVRCPSAVSTVCSQGTLWPPPTLLQPLPYIHLLACWASAPSLPEFIFKSALLLNSN